ncbi:MAG TPA: hypothetical protein VGI12_22790 [Vicinamibacterales bacterium]|jgi:hypothetical protein
MSPVPPKTQPALYAGIAIGVLSGLPVVNIGNCLCCLWVVGGGVLAVYLMQKEHPYPVGAADGALVGLMAGALGGIVAALIAIPISMAMGPFQQRLLERIVDNPDVPEQYRSMIQNMGMGAARSGAIAFRLVFGLIGACIYAVFGLLGGLLGVALFKKKDLPPGTTEILPPA